MLESCRRAAEIGLGGIAFTEHADLTHWVLPTDAPIDHDWRQYLDGRTLRPPPLDVAPYLAMIDECRRQHPQLLILSGVELGEPHWHHSEVTDLLAAGRFDRVISSVHSGPVDGGAVEVSALFAQHAPGDAIRGYLAEVLRMLDSADVRILAHIDYAARYWPRDAGPFRPTEFEFEHRQVLAALADRDGALEINTRRPLEPEIVAWWVEEGGRQVTFGSDSHAPPTVGAGLPEAAQLAANLGFRPSANLADPWRLSG